MEICKPIYIKKWLLILFKLKKELPLKDEGPISFTLVNILFIFGNVLIYCVS